MLNGRLWHGKVRLIRGGLVRRTIGNWAGREEGGATKEGVSC